jgi:phosphoribosylformimino-5-aminoimidazole carboxamide ribotide isomerase
MVVDFGGGIKTEEEVRRVFESGAAIATVGSIAVKNEAMLLDWFSVYGVDRFMIGADVKGEMIAVGGWLEETQTDVFCFIERYMRHGVRQLFCTDVSKDGRMEGPSIDLYTRIIARFPDLSLIASGGVSNMDDLHALDAIGCSGAIVGKAIYEDAISLDDLQPFLT